MKVHGFDIDGVVTNPAGLVTSIAKEYPGFTYNNLVKYDIGESLVAGGFITSLDKFSPEDFFREHNNDILAEADIADGFLNYLHRIRDHEIHFITARGKELEDFTERLFYKHGIHYQNVNHVGSREKTGLVTSLGLTHFYEDNLDTAIAVGGLGTVDVVLVDTMYNQMAELPHKTMRRIKLWGELVW